MSRAEGTNAAARWEGAARDGQSVGRQPLLRAERLVRHFATRRHLFSRTGSVVRAVDDVDLAVMPGETVGIVGESGCGKSTLGRLLLRLIEPTAGKVYFEGEDLGTLDAGALRERRRSLQIIFQDPYSSLNPTMTVASLLAEPLRLHRLARSAANANARVAELLRTVGLSPDHARRYPHEFSGGQRQRIGIARALAVEPKLIVCDEAVSALDVSVQAQVINLMRDLQRRFGLAYVFIAHDLAVVRHIADRVAVMYLGRIVEIGDKEEIFSRPRHPYTRALLDAVPRSTPRASAATGAGPARRLLLEGDIPNPSAPPSGCRFHSRCPFVQARCRVEEPLLESAQAPASAPAPGPAPGPAPAPVSNPALSPALASTAGTGEHLAACHFAEEIARTGRLPANAPEAASDPSLSRRLQRLQEAFVHDTPHNKELQ